jgi:DNA-binding transcriptional regulator YiaG
LAEWARRLGCNPAAILARLASGMSEAEAVTKPIPERPNSRLTPDEALSIRAAYPNLSAQKLADLYGVSKKTILNVIHGKTFAVLH